MYHSVPSCLMGMIGPSTCQGQPCSLFRTQATSKFASGLGMRLPCSQVLLSFLFMWGVSLRTRLDKEILRLLHTLLQMLDSLGLAFPSHLLYETLQTLLLFSLLLQEHLTMQLLTPTPNEDCLLNLAWE